jgi:hypothetical protein
MGIFPAFRKIPGLSSNEGGSATLFGLFAHKALIYNKLNKKSVALPCHTFV